ncbi:D-tyrosyl-tRNA(Tyr) deacylase [Alteromonas pelagimontana]|uniref:D-aminoacyl-tRNA deacylase n=1 Tax=Alteromonas pelagimontana TaxID=1858656 RepID=A0A6M4MED5_9ALTE|nr:D-aminoacyl-tRNA deacylase [Alteromonas pelagimontana]QJR81453.1 D-tyrosyl-tRNA(Tyr) deacylase [Alteromonas pelagimontana]
MIGLIQRVSRADVTVDGQPIAEINQGILLLLGVERADGLEQVEKMAQKVSQYRIFSDENGKMNLNVQQVGGKVLVVSQFTLVADTRKGNRPGFSKGATPEIGEQRYLQLIDSLRGKGVAVETGRFGADMQVSLVNDGPVTFYFQV